MSAMISALFEGSPLLLLPLAALLLFLMAWLVVVVRAVRATPAEYEAVARLPLDSSEGEEP